MLHCHTHESVLEVNSFAAIAVVAVLRGQSYARRSSRPSGVDRGTRRAASRPF